MSVTVYRTEIKPKPHFRGVDSSNKAIEINGIHIHINMTEFITNLGFIWVL